MNRIQFMSELAALLQDVSAEEREEALQYYNDYFDDAGEENEESIINELSSPEKVAAIIKAGLNGQDEESGEYSESGYQDTRFDDRETPARRGEAQKKNNTGYQESKRDTDRQENNKYYDNTGYQGDTGYNPEGKPKSSNTLKIVLIILLIIFGAPIAIPIGCGILALIMGAVLAVAGVFVGLFAAAVAVLVAGIVVFVIGVTKVIVAFPVALFMTGSGLLIFVIGMIATVGMVKLCLVALPGIVRGIVWLCRKPFQRKAVS